MARVVRAHIGQQHRYAHVVRVARCAELLAFRHGVDTHKARTAGLLHDIARLYSSEQLVRGCTERGMEINAFEAQNPIVLHAPLGAKIASELLDVNDTDVLSAIEKHTLASAEMSPLDCIIYLSDALEPGRRFDDRAALWSLSLQDLHAAMRGTIASSIRHHLRQGSTVAPQTVAAAHAFDVQEEGVFPSLT